MRAVWCGFALGVIVLQRQARLPGWGGWLGLALCVVMGAAWALWVVGVSRECGWRRASMWLAVWLVSACVGFGYAAWRAEWRLAQSLPDAWQKRDIEVTGHIARMLSQDAEAASFLFSIESWGMAAPPSHTLPDLVQLGWVARDAPLPTLVPGTRWRLHVRLKRPHAEGNFGLRDAEATLLSRGVRASGYVSDEAHARRLQPDAGGTSVRIERSRAAVRARIDRVLADAPHRGIVIALATGAQDAVSDDDWRRLRNTGTSHLVAISGLHLAFVAGLAGWIAGALWRRARWRGVQAPLILPAQRVAVLGAMVAAAAYAALAGFNVPVQRAFWMLAVTALALWRSREVSRSHVLAWALGLVLLRDPWAVTAPGFWLSFGAVGAILFAVSGVPRVRRDDEAALTADELDPMREHDVAPPRLGRLRAIGHRVAAIFGWTRWRRRVQRLIGRISDSARVQWAVTLALAPLTAYWFMQIPLIGPIANAAAIPWVSMFVTPMALAGVALPVPMDAYAWQAAHTMLGWLLDSLGRLEGWPWALVRLPQPGMGALFCAGVGVAWLLAPRGWPLRWLAPFSWLPLLVPAPGGPPPGAFRLTALDIGQGTSVLVETERHTLLFDAGPGPESTHAGERIVAPYLQTHGVRRLDTLMISHDDSDHSGGAPAVLDAVPVREFVAGIMPGHPLWASARKLGAQTVQCAAGQRWQWDGVTFEVLWPDPGPLVGKPNAHCCVLRVSTAAGAAGGGGGGPVSALLAADIEAGAERTLVARDAAGLRSQVLVVPHHGSRTSSTEPFLDSVWPLVAIFQVGYLNRFHHPHPGVYARYASRHIVLARSDADGAVRIEAAPGVLAVERFRDTQRRYWMDPAGE